MVPQSQSRRCATQPCPPLTRRRPAHPCTRQASMPTAPAAACTWRARAARWRWRRPPQRPASPACCSIQGWWGMASPGWGTSFSRRTGQPLLGTLSGLWPATSSCGGRWCPEHVPSDLPHLQAACGKGRSAWPRQHVPRASPLPPPDQRCHDRASSCKALTCELRPPCALLLPARCTPVLISTRPTTSLCTCKL